LGEWFSFDAALTGGLYAGASTNTPALAGLLDAIQLGADAGAVEVQSQQAVVGYSLAYPMGVLGVIMGLVLLKRVLKINFAAEAKELARDYPLGDKLVNRTFRVEHEALAGKTLREFIRDHNVRVAFGRLFHNGNTTLTTWDSRPERGDLIVLIGTEDCVREAATLIGPPAEGEITYDRSVFDVRRIFISNEDIAGKTIASLNLQQKFNVLITRVQRGDMDLLATGDTVLELGDRILIVAHRSDLPELFKTFGNSYEALSKVNLLSFGFGITLGLLLGMVKHHPAGWILLQFRICWGTIDRGPGPGTVAENGSHRLDTSLRRQSHPAAGGPDLPPGRYRHSLGTNVFPDHRYGSGMETFPGGGHNCHRHHPRYPDYRLPNLAYSLQLSRRNGG
jgi:putative transport protein